MDIEGGERNPTGDPSESKGRFQCCKTFNFAGTNINVTVGTTRTTSVFGFLTALVILVIFVLVIVYGLNHLTIHLEANKSN